MTGRRDALHSRADRNVPLSSDTWRVRSLERMCQRAPTSFSSTLANWNCSALNPFSSTKCASSTLRCDRPIESVATPSRVPSLRIMNAEYFASSSLIVVARPSSRACHFEKVDRWSNLNCRDVSVITRVVISEPPVGSWSYLLA